MTLKNPNEYDKGKTIVYLIRHGDRLHIEGSKEPHDFSLSKKGISQAKSLAKNLEKIKDEIDVLYSSTMKRAKETATIVGKKINKRPIILENFEELNKILEKPAYFKLRYWKERIKLKKSEKVFNQILEKNKGKVIVLVAHGRLNKILMGRKLGLNLEKSNCFHATTCHLACLRFNNKKLERIYCVNSKEIPTK